MNGVILTETEVYAFKNLLNLAPYIRKSQNYHHRHVLFQCHYFQFNTYENYEVYLTINYRSEMTVLSS